MFAKFSPDGSRVAYVRANNLYVEDVDRDPVVLVDGLTKNWRYPGWRVTWTLGPKKVIEAIEPSKDVDCFTPANVGKVQIGLPGPVSCTPAGIEALLAFYDVPVAGREVCILGRGTTLGRPFAGLGALPPRLVRPVAGRARRGALV